MVSDGNNTESSEGEPSDTMRKRAGENRLKLWLLLEANRWFVSAVPLVLVFASLIVLGVLDPVPLRAAMKSADPVETLFQALLTATITGVTLVVSINSLVLSQELGPLGDQRQRMSGAMEFRRDVEEDLDVTAAPPEPSAFLRALVVAVSDRAETLGEALSTGDDGEGDAEFRSRLEEYVDELRENASEVSDELEGGQFGTFDVLFAALDFNYSWKIYQARRLRNEYEDELPEAVDEAFDELVNVLTYFGPAREHFKTLYFQWELINLSRAMLYAAVPSLLVSTAAILYLDNPGTITGTTFGVDNMVWTVTAATAVAVFPFTILLSFILRIATAAKRTLSIGPFILRSETRNENLD
ncbi:hypothetical protein [Halopelagius fulvigenes]|uniref:Uncharacterized protein n=1 Tax=Halopelagius fulvigenes TaxID=1198324 RepID=A0ABD5TVR6_9EURY